MKASTVHYRIFIADADINLRFRRSLRLGHTAACLINNWNVTVENTDELNAHSMLNFYSLSVFALR